MKILLVNSKIIKDPVHGYVEVDEEILPLLDSPAIQRLRYIHQLGFSYLVYPGANHTRFEHSVGTMHLAGVACRQFGLSKEERRLVLVAALLHDVGHGPFSHASEPLMEAYLGRTHDDIAGIVEKQFKTLLEPLEISPSDVCAIVKGSHRLSGIIHGDLDVDRMDYLLRDAYYSGAPYGTVDAHRLIRNIHLTPEGIALDENGLNAAESLLIARTLMRPTVYFHHVSRIGECMFQLAVLDHIATCPAAVSSVSLHSTTENACMNSKTRKVLLPVSWQIGSAAGGSINGPCMPGKIRLMQLCFRLAGQLSEGERSREKLLIWRGAWMPMCWWTSPRFRGHVARGPGKKPACARGFF